MARLILDTGVLIAAVRARVDLAALADTDDVAVPAVAIAEYTAGVLLETDPARAAAQHAFLDDVLTVVPTIDYDHSVATHHAALLAHTHRAGHRRGPHDLIIAATARATGRTLLTTDAHAHFDQLPDVTAHLITT